MADPDRPFSSPRPFKYYCELLTNIQQVSISISSSPSPSTTASHHPSKRAILLSQQSSPCPLPIFLPARVSPKQPLTASQSYRLPTLHNYTEEPDPKTAPWSASSFSPSSSSSSSSSSPSSIHCNSCAAELIPSGRIQEWKDLPNENWADLMDFWHCHKPHDDPPMNGEEEGEKEEGHASHHGHKDEAKETTTTTGGKYAKYGNVAAKKGVGLVEMMFLLVDRSNCNDGSIQMTQTTTTPSKQSFTPIHCTSCTSPLGVFDNKSTGYRLMKWSLCIRHIPLSSPSSSSLSSPHKPYFKSYDTQQWVSSHLVYLADSQGSRKFTIQHDYDDDNDNNKKKSFRIWLFNPYTVVTTHVYRIPTDAVKVYYRCDITPTTPTTTTTTTTINGEKDKEGGKGGGGGKVGVDGTALQDPETVYLPGRVYDVIWSVLEGNNREMPEELRVWGEWRTSWMKRFGQADL